MSFAGLILAGGLGKRWGGPKAFAQLPDGLTFLEACTEALCGSGATPVAATLPPSASDPGIVGLEALPLLEQDLDMFGSLCFGLQFLVENNDWQSVAVLPVDHPLVKADTLNTLASVRAPAVIPSFLGKHGHPVFLSRSIAQAITEGELKGPTLREVLYATKTKDMDVKDPGVITNCNTPEMLSAALAAGNVLAHGGAKQE